MIIENYNSKSFYVKCDNFLSNEDKSSFKTLGGKWCPNLKDSDNNKFGAWIFPISKRNSVELYLNNGITCPATPKNCDENGKINWDIAIEINKLKMEVETLSKKILILEQKLMTK